MHGNVIQKRSQVVEEILKKKDARQMQWPNRLPDLKPKYHVCAVKRAVVGRSSSAGVSDMLSNVLVNNHHVFDMKSPC
ncbi:hypothetical protein CEXT_450621 [Caerostris extrusa]|uniref:Uncharacterized protein n=1 Tax=Caerostris extrusa TaxID=172846 RepID=A0AAV4Y3V1_CAEEX|nr:hypothetical protein CEXT_450621 [Caerostris extrusa]